MKIKYITILSFIFISSICFAQVDVVYNDLVWSDEFDSNGSVDSNKWFHQTQLPAGGNWNNGEVQHYTNQLSNSYINNGFLNITAIKEVFTDQGQTKQYTSARLNSKFAFKYGRVDVRAKIPINQGTWPAIWLLGKNINEDGAYFDANYGTTNWPACGEIDIMEHGIFPSQSINYVQSTLHTPSSFGNSINHGGVIASDLANNYHVYSMNWSPNEISFLLDDVVYYTYNPTNKNASNWPFDKDQFLLLNVAMGGIAGNIPSNFTQATMEIDYVRVYQNVTVDNQEPTNFTAQIGNVTSSTIELLLNGVDNSGTVAYNISYSGGSISVSNPSGIQKSVVIPNLSPNTNYTFTINASDLSGNTFANNPIILNATTTELISCNGTGNQAQQGAFSIGYNYTFETLGNNVKITFELLDTDKVGVVAFLWKQNPFTEYQMTNVTGNVYTYTITNQTIGSTINYAVKFAYSGGLSVTNYISYTVGENCSLGYETPNTFEFSFLNPAQNILNISSINTIDSIEIFDFLGKKIISQSNQNTVDISKLSKGIFILKVYSDNKVGIKKMIKN